MVLDEMRRPPGNNTRNVNQSPRNISFIFNIIFGTFLLAAAYFVFSELNYQSELQLQFEMNISSANNNKVLFPRLKPVQVIWFGRRMSAENPWAEIKREWLQNGFSESLDSKKLWIPLNHHDSFYLEHQWRQNYNVCQLSGVDDQVVLMNGLYSVFEMKENLFILKPVYWNKEKDFWVVIRSPCVYEIRSPPPILYFSHIQPSLNNKFNFYQPIPCDLEKSKIMETEYINNIVLEKHPIYEHVVFVVHGIGHFKGEEGIVENANDILNGFISYQKKIYPNLTIPMVIPVAWRFNLPLNDRVIQSIRSTKNEQIKNLALIMNDILYYASSPYGEEMRKNLIVQLNKKYELFIKTNPDFSGSVSILAHSLGTVLTFDILNDHYESLGFEVKNLFFLGSPLPLYLANKGITAEKIREFPWIKNETLFNIIHSDDPVAHRIEPLFHSEYNATEPYSMSMSRDFRNTFFKSIKATPYEINEISMFQHRLLNNSKIVKGHDSFLIYEYPNDTLENDAEYFPTFSNYYYISPPPCKNTTIFVKSIAEKDRLKYRIDFNIYKSEYYINIEPLYYDMYAGIWGYEFVFAHISYWQRPEVSLFILQSLFNITSPITEYPANQVYPLYDTKKIFHIVFFKPDIFRYSFFLFIFICISGWHFYKSARRFSFLARYLHSDKTNFSYISHLFHIFLVIGEFLLCLLIALMLLSTTILVHTVFDLFLFNQSWNVKCIIYGILFIPPTINLFLININSWWNEASFTLNYFSSIKLFLFISHLFWAAFYLYSEFTQFHRAYDLKCRNSEDDGLCKAYQMFNSSHINVLNYLKD